MEDGAVPKRRDAPPDNLPLQLNRFIGREREMAAVRELLVTTRPLTLTGAGGSGKTRIALQVATDLVEDFAHGVWWVELAALSDPLLVPQVVASGVGISERAGCTVTEAISEALRPRHLLLVLDNCEHLLAASIQLIETLLHTCPQVHVLVTRGEALAITGETTWPVLPLRVPDTNQSPPVEGLLTYEAVQLFVERARAVLPSFTLTPENASPVVQVCRRLDGMPLAIEGRRPYARALCGADRRTSRRCVSAPHRWKSVGLTSAANPPGGHGLELWLVVSTRTGVFRRLSVFAGSFSLEAAEAICAGEPEDAYDVLDVLSSLIDKSLVVMEPRRGEARYRLLETIRQYGQDKLQECAEAATMRRHHRDWYAGLAQRAEPETLEARQKSVFDRLEAEHEDLRAALGWSLEQQDAETAARIGAAISRFWLLRGYMSEGRRWLERALSGFSEKNAVRVKALNVAAILASLQDDNNTARRLVEESLELKEIREIPCCRRRRFQSHPRAIRVPGITRTSF
jgi:predicted ATPase